MLINTDARMRAGLSPLSQLFQTPRAPPAPFPEHSVRAQGQEQASAGLQSPGRGTWEGSGPQCVVQGLEKGKRAPEVLVLIP